METNIVLAIMPIIILLLILVFAIGGIIWMFVDLNLQSKRYIEWRRYLLYLDSEEKKKNYNTMSFYEWKKASK